MKISSQLRNQTHSHMDAIACCDDGRTAANTYQAVDKEGDILFEKLKKVCADGKGAKLLARIHQLDQLEDNLVGKIKHRVGKAIGHVRKAQQVTEGIKTER